MRGLAFTKVVLTLSLCWLSVGAASADDREQLFESKIRPVLVGTCFRCHGDAKTAGGLRVDSRESLLKGGESGPAIVPGHPDESLLIQAIRHQADVSAMPPEKELTLRPDQVADFVAWIKAEAAWPAQSTKFVGAKHWAFEPVRDAAPPQVLDTAWGQTSIDAFIRAKQETAGVHPAPTADKRTLIRRATFDLTGLPPTPEDIDAFLLDDSPEAFEAVINRLLQSHAYGEKWGRHWLDVVRYADTAGETADYPVPLAWRYRNYVIDAFNTDKPYDKFLQEQIAGDILANQGPPDQYAERVSATGYLAISRRFGFDSENYHHLTIQDTIDTLGQSVLGLSLGCVRCHDHKFDPLSTQDYYALYGIFDSSRYAFPGSEQKQRVRSMVPLVPPHESQPKWREFEQRVAVLSADLTRQKRPVPSALLRSLNDLDGDFEQQAPAAGGSNGVLVPPWLYEGKIAVTHSAQSPFTNLYPQGKVGASIAADAGAYRISQALYPARTRATSSTMSVNLDFRVAAPAEGVPGSHRFTIGANRGSPTAEFFISSQTLSLRMGDQTEVLGTLPVNQWQNLQVTIDLPSRTLSGRFGMPGVTTELTAKALSADWPGVIDLVVLDSGTNPEPKRPGIEFDNLGVHDAAIAPVSTELPTIAIAADAPDPAALAALLQTLGGIDGDFELQAKATPPASPWGPGPNSVVQVSAESQSPYQNLFAAGQLGIHMPNRAEYDGFGITLPNVQPDKEGHLYVNFDFRCAHQDAGGNGSWRYYIGHGPGNSAAVELFFNGTEFFRRSADARDPISPLVIGQWYQVQLILDLRAKTYTGSLASTSSKTDFTGQLASGWDGAIDYSFIDSYGHLGGVRPALDADNFVVRDQPLLPLDAPSQPMIEADSRRQQVTELRRQLATLATLADQESHELNSLLADGPLPLAYGMAEGTPHNARIHKRGEPDQLGDVVPRGFLQVLGDSTLPEGTNGSGRLELAQWLTRPRNPLTARVMVNRLWQYHFGQGLVKTPNDFGFRGRPPTHPELLDHLATRFVESGWSMKSIHRLIMLSATYQQASDRAENTPSGVDTSDLYVRCPRRRLNAEEIRDSILAVSGELDPTPGREHPFPAPTSWGYSQHGPFIAVYDTNKRSVYLMTQRLKRHPFLALFDGADPNATTADRLGTTVPTQALFFLNDPMIHVKADKWAGRLLAAAAGDSQRLDIAWRQALGRLPTETERAESVEFLTAYRSELAAANMDNIEQRSWAAYLRTLIGSNEFLHVD